MVSHLNVDQLRALMDLPHNIRNMCIIAHVDHGKSTLADSLVASNGIISKSDIGRRKMDDRDDEQAKGITIKSSGISLHYSLPEYIPCPSGAEGRQFLINLIDSPGHVDFSSEVTAALRMTDGALVLVDCIEGCCVQTETVLRQALAQSIKPILDINKIDRALTELKLSPEEIYQCFCRSIESVNTLIGSYNPILSEAEEETLPKARGLGDCTVYPERGTVIFSAGKQGWAFTLRDFARMYSSKLGVSEDKLVEKLWGENYYDSEKKRWTTSPSSTAMRGFCKFVLEPIMKMFEACLSEDRDRVDKMLKVINLTLKTEERELPGKELLKAIMQKWLPASEALLESIVTKLPSPAAAQKYRVESLYRGPMDDETAQAIRSCSRDGPLVFYVAKMIPTKDNSRFYAFGRVFSGMIESGRKVNVIDPNYVPRSNTGGGNNSNSNSNSNNNNNSTNSFKEGTIQRVVIVMGGKTEPVSTVPAGNTCAVIGIDHLMVKGGTVTSNVDSYPLIDMTLAVSPVVRVAVEPVHTQDLPKLVEGLKRLTKADSLVEVSMESSGQYVIACAGELHLSICLEDLKNKYCSKAVELRISEPVVNYRETVTKRSSVNCLAKTQNALNRLIAVADPLVPELVLAMESGKVGEKDEPKARAKLLVEEYGWDATEARKIWAFGPLSGKDGTTTTNVIVDSTRAIQYMNEIRDSVVASFQWTTREGLLAGEGVRGVRYSILDAVLHSDSAHRGGGQIIPAARRVFYAAQYTASPRLMEPIFLVNIQCNDTALSGVYNVVNQRRGLIFETLAQAGSPLYNVKGYLPVSESFGFTEQLRSQTSGQAFPQCVFDHWETIEDDPLEEGSRAYEIVRNIRTRKGMNVEVPALDKYLDKL